jgi:hypothetical protein
MLACGVGLVDVRIKFSELNFGGDDIVRYCDGTPESMVEACEHLLNDPRELETRRRRGYEFTRRMPDDDELGKAFVRAAGLADRQEEGTSIEPVYRDRALTY